MKIHEYQAKELFRAYDIPVPRGIVADNAAQCAAAAKELGGELFAVKAQVHAGGRGKGGGVKLAKSFSEVESAAAAMFAKPLVTHQTGSEGIAVHRVLVEEGCPFDRQFYVGIVLDRAAEKPVMMVSREGGVEIEQVARERPAAIVKEHFDPRRGLDEKTAGRLAESLGLSGAQAEQAAGIMQSLAKIFLEKDCSLIEINPLVLTKKGAVAAIDAKCTFDDNALFRYEDVQAMRDRSEEDPREAEAADYGFSYVSLDGNIACMVNGAGLAMATNDIITHAGGTPANFLDVGGAADPERVTNAFKLLLGDERVRTVLVNIFGGIVKCDVIATGIVEALKVVPLTVPMVVRLEGTNVDEGRRILRESGHPLIEATDFQDAAAKAVAAVKGSATGAGPGGAKGGAV
jgi:succinyl-CoA synthetase beta subunit